ncbi:hypothetical protein ACROYT_G034855 [Oculina patagonica]
MLQEEDINFWHSPAEDHLQSGSSQDGVLPTPLHAAAVNGNKSLLQRLLQEDDRGLINKGDQFGRTPLVYSVLGDRLDCAELLLKAGANVSECDMDGRTPLHWATYQGNLKCVKLLLAKGANWKVKDHKGRTPLHFATSHQSSKCLSMLLKRVPKGEADERDNDQMTSFHWSASYGNAEHVKLLLKAGSTVTLTDLEKKTPLHWAVTNPDPAVVKLILDANSDIINNQDNEGRTALHLAVAQQNEAAVKVLLSIDKCKVSLQDNMKRSPLHWAAVLGNPQLVRMLLERNADFTAADGNGATALHYVAQSNFSETVKVFLSFDKIKDIPDNEGRTALMWAAGKGSENTLETMLEHNLDVHAKDKTGGTALHSAAYSGHVTCVKLLIQFGACVDALDMLQHTPIFRACEMGHTAVVCNLILNGATVNLEDQDGRTLLHWAALGGHAPICLALIEQGLAVDSKDHLGRTPLQCAAHGGFVKFMTVLIEHGAELDHQDKDGITALHWSCASGHLEAVKLLIRNRAFPNFTESDTDRLTPLDYAIIGDHQDVAQYMIEQGALTINGIQDIAATTIQKCWRGYAVRKAFENRKNQLMRHERLLKGKKRASAAEQKRTGDLSGIQSPRSVSPSIREQSESSVYDSGISLEVSTAQENQEKASLTSTEEQRHSQNASTTNELLVPDAFVQHNSTKGLVTDLLYSSSEEERCPSPRQESENKFQDNAELMRIISSVLLEENVELEEGFLFKVGKNSQRQSEQSDLPHKESANKLHSVASKSELARRERERLHLIRTKVNAAVLIQRWFRKWTSIRRERVEQNLMLSDVKNEQEELNKEVAALTIQLAWRKHVRLEYEKNSARTKRQKTKKPPTSNSASCKPKQNGIHIYGRSIQKGPPINYTNSRSANKRRQAYMKYEPSPAAMSYNMAMDLYHPMGSRQGNSRAAMVTASTRVRPGSMKRTVSGWSHDDGFLTKVYGQKTATKEPRT